MRTHFIQCTTGLFCSKRAHPKHPKEIPKNSQKLVAIIPWVKKRFWFLWSTCTGKSFISGDARMKVGLSFDLYILLLEIVKRICIGLSVSKSDTHFSDNFLYSNSCVEYWIPILSRCVRHHLFRVLLFGGRSSWYIEL